MILLFSVSTRLPFYRFLRNYINPELSFNFILDPGLIVEGLMVVLAKIRVNAPLSISENLQRLSHIKYQGSHLHTELIVI